MATITAYSVSAGGFSTKIGTFDSLAQMEAALRYMSDGSRIRVSGDPSVSHGTVHGGNFVPDPRTLSEDTGLDTPTQKRSITARLFNRRSAPEPIGPDWN